MYNITVRLCKQSTEIVLVKSIVLYVQLNYDDPSTRKSSLTKKQVSIRSEPLNFSNSFLEENKNYIN